MEKKITKKEMFGKLLAIDGVKNNKALVDFINHEVELLSRKSGKNGKLTPKQLENIALQERILDILKDGNTMTVSEIVKEFNFEYSSQKVSAMLKQLLQGNKVNRSEIKGVAYFGVAVD